MTKVIPGQLKLIGKLSIKNKRPVDKQAAYAQGFVVTCVRNHVDPKALIEMVNSLELAL